MPKSKTKRPTIRDMPSDVLVRIYDHLQSFRIVNIYLAQAVLHNGMLELEDSSFTVWKQYIIENDTKDKMRQKIAIYLLDDLKDFYGDVFESTPNINRIRSMLSEESDLWAFTLSEIIDRPMNWINNDPITADFSPDNYEARELYDLMLQWYDGP